MEFTQDHIMMLQETHDTVIRISTVLLGADGDKGLVGKVEETRERQDELEDRQNKSESNWKMLIGYMIGTSIITGGTVAGLVKLFGG